MKNNDTLIGTIVATTVTTAETPEISAAPVVPAAKTFDQQLQETSDHFELHELYKKHEYRRKQDADGDDTDDSDDPLYVDWDTNLCPGCHMPVEQKGSRNGGHEGECTYNSLDTFLDPGCDKQYLYPASYVVAMRTRMRDWAKSHSSRTSYNHLCVTQNTIQHKRYLDVATMRKQVIAYLDGKASVKDHDYQMRNGHTELVRLEHHLMGGVTPETRARLMKCAAGDTDVWATPRNEAATLELALALHNKEVLDKATTTLLMKRCKDLRLKHELTARTGAFRLSAVRGTEFNDCLASYYYIQKYKPELLKDVKWVAKKLRFDKHHTNRLVILRYYIDYGLGAEYIADDSEFVAAIAKLMPRKHANTAADIDKWKEDQGEYDGWEYVFGSVSTRRRLYHVESEYHLIAMCPNIETYFSHLMPESMRNITKDPVADVLKCPGKPDGD